MGVGLHMKNIISLVVGGLLTTTLSSCLKPPSQEQHFGPENTLQDIQSGFNAAPSPSPYSIESGEFAYLEKSIQIESQPPEVIYQRGDTIINKKETATDYILTVVTETREKIDGAMKPAKKESDVYLPKIKTIHQLSQLFSISSFSQTSKFLITPSSIKSLWLSANSLKIKTEKVTYHNYKKTDQIFKTPDLVKNRDNCGGLSPSQCLNGIKVTEIRFDKVIWTERGGDKASFQFILSSETPYLASQLLACVHSRVDYQGQRVNIIQCEKIKDFKFGQKNLNSVPKTPEKN